MTWKQRPWSMINSQQNVLSNGRNRSLLNEMETMGSKDHVKALLDYLPLKTNFQ